jgi:trans-aconitate 2-methyltransferase
MSAVRRDWDASSYHRVSAVMDGMADQVLDRLPLAGDETVLDAGCGTGRVTARLLDRLPDGRVVAVDADPAMVELARATLPPGTTVIESDLLDLTLPSPVDAVFSTATFHWVLDHDRLFARLGAALRPGGILVAQCGGHGNVAALTDTAMTLTTAPEWAPYFAGFTRNWTFETPEATSARLRAAGFVDVECWLQPFSLEPPEPLEYLVTVPLGSWVQKLPEERRHAFAAQVWDAVGRPTVDYVRLNISARRC